MIETIAALISCTIGIRDHYKAIPVSEEMILIRGVVWFFCTQGQFVTLRWPDAVSAQTILCPLWITAKPARSI
jgi:hypothetical protein